MNYEKWYEENYSNLVWEFDEIKAQGDDLYEFADFVFDEWVGYVEDRNDEEQERREDEF